MALDFFKPMYYQLEKLIASKGIPAVHEIENRLTLKSFGSESDSDSDNGNGNGNDNYATATATATATFDHSLWNQVLQTHVDDSGTTVTTSTINQVTGIHTVDYAGVAADPKFAEYLELLNQAEPSKLSGPEQLAFWMNVYNALCINIILQYEESNSNNDDDDDDNSIASINEISNKETPVWNRMAGTVAGTEISLNQVEHEQLRAKWNEPALHACIVCASASCPNLRTEAFTGEKVAEQMKDQMTNWMKNDSKGIKLLSLPSSSSLPSSLGDQQQQQQQKTLMLSRIFLWFQDDFGGWEGLQKWLPQYIEDAAIKEAIANTDKNVKVRYFEYDWNINRAANKK